MFILGITGGIGSGKSTVARMLRRNHIPVFDADHAVSRLLQPGKAGFLAVARMFPDCILNGQLQRTKLAARVFANPAERQQLEQALHPLVRQAQKDFLKQYRRQRRTLVALDIPLLLETGGERACNTVALVYAPLFLRQQRVLRRPGMSGERFRRTVAAQWPDSRKRRKAQYWLPSGLGMGVTCRKLHRLLKRIDLLQKL
jgi:dephospho-CoA kinase